MHSIEVDFLAVLYLNKLYCTIYWNIKAYEADLVVINLPTTCIFNLS